jgi:hypothetical protein
MIRLMAAMALLAALGCSGEEKAQSKPKGDSKLGNLEPTPCDAMLGSWIGTSGETVKLERLATGQYQAEVKLKDFRSNITIACEDGGIDVGGEGWLRIKGESLTFGELTLQRKK